MKKFEFKLSSVLILRQRALGVAEKDYGVAIQAKKEIEAQIQAEQASLLANNLQIVEERKKPVFGVQAHAYNEELHMREERIAKLQESFHLAKIEEAKKRAIYIEARKRFELLEKLKKQQEKEHEAEISLKEQAELDDLFNAKRTDLPIGR